MKQYTTPIETLLLPIDISTGYDIYVYLKSGGTNVVEKTNDDISVTYEDGHTKIKLMLSQEETGKLAKSKTQVEVTWKNRASGCVGKSEVAYIEGYKSLKQEVV